MIGINNRDLTTLEVDTGRTFELLPRVPGRRDRGGRVGLQPRPASSTSSRGAGVDAVLIGEALMRSPDIEAACRELTVR